MNHKAVDMILTYPDRQNGNGPPGEAGPRANVETEPSVVISLSGRVFRF
jgi:hypothetical protein